MASEITEHDQNASPSVHDDQNPNNGALVQGDANRGTKRPRPAADDDDDDDDKPGRERRKIEIKFIQDKSRRHITFSKRKAGIMKKVRTPFPSFSCVVVVVAVVVARTRAPSLAGSPIPVLARACCLPVARVHEKQSPQRAPR